MVEPTTIVVIVLVAVAGLAAWRLIRRPQRRRAVAIVWADTGRQAVGVDDGELWETLLGALEQLALRRRGNAATGPADGKPRSVVSATRTQVGTWRVTVSPTPVAARPTVLSAHVVVGPRGVTVLSVAVSSPASVEDLVGRALGGPIGRLVPSRLTARFDPDAGVWDVAAETPEERDDAFMGRVRSALTGLAVPVVVRLVRPGA